MSNGSDARARRARRQGQPASSPARSCARTSSARSRSAPTCRSSCSSTCWASTRASSDEMAIQMGLQVVNDTLANNYIRPDESHEGPEPRSRSRARTRSSTRSRCAWSTPTTGRRPSTSATSYLHIPTHYVRDYERLLTGGIWAQVDMRFEYDEETKRQAPVLDREAHAHPDRHLRPGRVPARRGASSPPTSGSTSSSAAWATSRPRCRGGSSSCSCVRLIPLARAQLQPRRARPARHRQELRRCRRSRPTRRCSPAPTTVANLFGHMSGTPEGHGADLGRRRLRRGGRPPEDAQGGHHHDEDLLRVGHVPARRRRRSPATPASRCSATRTSRST